MTKKIIKKKSINYRTLDNVIAIIYREEFLKCSINNYISYKESQYLFVPEQFYVLEFIQNIAWAYS